MADSLTDEALRWCERCPKTCLQENCRDLCEVKFGAIAGGLSAAAVSGL